jgi:hypothetical protein
MTFCESKYKLNIKLNDSRIFDYYNKFVNHHAGDSGMIFKFNVK